VAGDAVGNGRNARKPVNSDEIGSQKTDFKLGSLEIEVSASDCRLSLEQFAGTVHSFPGLRSEKLALYAVALARVDECVWGVAQIEE
jgi:hypothetical protein